MAYELHPETPPAGVPLERFLPNAAAMLRHVRSFAEGFGIRDLLPPALLSSTRRALAVAEHARDAGRVEAFRAGAYDAYWRRGQDLGSDAVLAAVAREAGLDPEAALAAAADPALRARVEAGRARAVAEGVTAIPTFDVGPTRIVGCQPYETLAGAARRAGAARAAR